MVLLKCQKKDILVGKQYTMTSSWQANMFTIILCHMLSPPPLPQALSSLLLL